MVHECSRDRQKLSFIKESGKVFCAGMHRLLQQTDDVEQEPSGNRPGSLRKAGASAPMPREYSWNGYKAMGILPFRRCLNAAIVGRHSFDTAFRNPSFCS